MTVCNTIVTSRTRYQEKEPTTLEEDDFSLSALEISSKEGMDQHHHSKCHQSMMIYTAVGSTPTHIYHNLHEQASIRKGKHEFKTHNGQTSHYHSTLVQFYSV